MPDSSILGAWYLVVRKIDTVGGEKKTGVQQWKMSFLGVLEGFRSKKESYYENKSQKPPNHH